MAPSECQWVLLMLATLGLVNFISVVNMKIATIIQMVADAQTLQKIGQIGIEGRQWLILLACTLISAALLTHTPE